MTTCNCPQNLPVHNLQQMLRLIETADGKKARIIPDGIYGTETCNSVAAFQQTHGLPVTGATDLETWNAVVRTSRHASVLYGPAESLSIILQPNQILNRDCDNVHNYLMQALLAAIGKFYEGMPCLEVTGKYDECTAGCIMWLQEHCDLPCTGDMDKRTWQHLVHLYRLIVGDGTGTFPVRAAQRSLPSN